ncbi:hypothetical protein KY285_035946 [Solanum tuberosum]|nr:hypothetical protein KY289_036104 [Solanum tuberosum]KAH0639360.1 hypothetical protein KY285_035946 [Solanum tuberosum]
MNQGHQEELGLGLRRGNEENNQDSMNNQENLNNQEGMVQLIHSSGQFTGLPHEDPQIHLRNFIDISATYIPTGVSSDYVRLTLFPYSLLGSARRFLSHQTPSLPGIT